jgi:Domain of unknown function (DUF4157)
MSERTIEAPPKATSLHNASRNGLLQRRCACGNHAAAPGEGAECAKNNSGLQRKLTIGASNDPLELEADRVADEVLAAPAHSTVGGIPRLIQRYTGQTTGGAETAPASLESVLASSGKPLEPALRQDMEQRFGQDFSRVRVYSGAAAEQSTRDVTAHAYTMGHHIVFGAGRFAPGTRDGMRLIAHELTHVVQQSGAGAGSGSPSGVLQRKLRSGASPAPDVDLGPLQGHDDAPAENYTPQAAAPDAAAVHQPSQGESLRSPTQIDASSIAAQSSSPQAPLTELDPGAPLNESPNTATDAETPTNATQAALVSATPAATDSAMPQLTDLLSRPQTQAVATDPGASPITVQDEGVAHDATSEQTDVDTGALLGTLALGIREARKTISAHSITARSDIDWQAKNSSKKLEVQTEAADEAVRTLANQRRTQIDKTILSHSAGLHWLEKQCKADANTYATNAQQAQIDGFASYRLHLADAFDWWERHFEKLNGVQSDRLTKETDKNDRAAWSIAKNYDSRYIQSYGGQSEERKEVQHDAVYAVAADYSSEIRKAKTEVLPELAKIPGQMKVELDKGRDAALVEFDKGLPTVLSGVHGQRDSALQDISNKAVESQTMLAKAALQMRQRVGSLEETALKRNAALRATIDAQIEMGRKNAAQEFRGAIPAAMEPIAAMADEALGMLTDSDEELDPEASERFIDEVVDFSLAAADETGEVFAGARDTSMQALAGAVPFAKRGLAAGKDDLAAALSSEGAENELALIRFSTEAEAYVRSPLINLDQTFNAAVGDADTKLLEMLNETRAKLREPMEETEKQIRQSVNDVLSQQVDAKRQLGRVMHNTARQVAWRYDHPYLKYVVDAVEVILGFALVIAIVVGLVVMLPVIVGEAAAAVILTATALIGAFMIGYFGAKAYDERKKAGASGVSAFFGALADVTGINDVRRAFTDPKMSPFDRGMAWGQFWLSMFGAAAGAPRFLKAIKVRLPKRFTNPFRAKGSSAALAAEAEGVNAIPHAQPLPETPKIGYELPDQKLPELEVPTAPATNKPGKIGYELPHQKALEPEVPQAPVASKPEKIGFELPHERTPSPSGDVVSPGPRHRKPSTPEAVPPAPKRKIGFRPYEEPALPIDAPTGARDQPHVGGESPPTGDVISQMPSARDVPSGQRTGSGAPQASGNRPAHAGEPPIADAPHKGSVVSKVEPETPPSAQAEHPLSARDEARLADERAVQSAREQRIADEERVKKLSDEFDEIEKFKKELGRRKKRDYVDEQFDQTKADLKQAESDLKRAQRAEAEAEAAERVGLRKRKDVDPGAAKHDPAVKERAQTELKERQALVNKNDELINANKKDVAKAEAKLAKREQELEATRPGSDAGPQSRDLARARARAQQKVDSAKRKLDAVRKRTKAAETANQNHYKRMQDLDREINPGPEMSGEKGNFGEQRTHEHMDVEEGYEFKGSSKEPRSNAKPSDKGLDGAYEKRIPEPGKPKHVAVEAKYDTSKLAPGQEKAEWVDERLDNAVGRDHANKMRLEGYEYWEMRYDPRLGRVKPKKLWEWRHNRKFGPGHKPLGVPHYFPQS